MTQEEDFVTNTYDRNFLSHIEVTEVIALLQATRAELRELSNGVPKDLALALDLRLELRIAFLRAMELFPLRKSNPDSLKMPWIQMKELMKHFKKQHELAKPVPEAFSTKMQRRLASTMPPRPIVHLSFDDTYTHFEQMFQDGKDAMDVLKYVDPQSLLVSLLLLHHACSVANMKSAFCIHISSERPPTACVYQNHDAGSAIQGHDRTRSSQHTKNT